MNKKEFDQIYVKKNVVVHCDTLAKATAFLKMASKFRHKWPDGDSYTKVTQWKDLKKNTCYYLYEDSYESVEFYTERGFEIIKYEIES